MGTPLKAHARPSPRGARLLGVVAAIKAVWRNAPDDGADPRGFRRVEQRSAKLKREAEALARGIARRVPRTPSDAADVIVAFSWFEQNRDYDDLGQRLASRLLSLAGLTLAQVDEEATA
jgi:hypothetical protein